MNQKFSVFYSYAHEDLTLRNQLEKHLIALQVEGLVESWHDHDIQPGAIWENTISEHLERADIILLLISVDFLSSKYCTGVEMIRALERARVGDAVVIPIILRPVDWENAPFRHLQCLPAGGRPVAKWGNRDDAFLDIERGIRKVVERLRAQQDPQAPRVSGGPARPEPAPAHQDRMLDAAMAPKVPMGKPADLAVMVRRVNSAGLKGVLEIDDEYSGRPEDVRSKPFRMEFPLDDGGNPKPSTLTLKLESPDFDPPAQTKKLPVPPDADSEVCTFLLTPLFTGELIVNLEVYATEGQQIARVFRIVSEASDRVLVRGRMLVSVPISTSAGKPAQSPPPPAAAWTRVGATPPSQLSVPELPSYEAPAREAPPSRQPTQALPSRPAQMPPVAASSRKKGLWAMPLGTAAMLVVASGVVSLYYTGQRPNSPNGSATQPSVAPPSETPQTKPQDPAARPTSISDLLAGHYVLQYTNLNTVAQFRAEIQLTRTVGDEFRFTSAASGVALPAGVPFQHQYQGTLKKIGPVWYVETVYTTDPTAVRGALRNDLTFEDGVLTLRAENGVVMAWRKQ